MTTAEAIKTLKPPITVEQWAELEEPPHYELVDGELREKPDVAFWHEILLYRLLLALGKHLSAQKLGDLVSSKAKLKIDRYRGREPDIFFIPTALYGQIRKNLFVGVPPLVIEILSPSNEDVDRDEKSAEYANLGVGQYWLIDFPNRAVEVYHLDVSGKKPKYELAETVAGPVFRPDLFPGLEIPLSDIWPEGLEGLADEYPSHPLK